MSKQLIRKQTALRLVIAGVFASMVLFALGWPMIRMAYLTSSLVSTLNQARQIHMAVQSAALDYVTTGVGKGGWAADVKPKTGLEYVAYLVQSGTVKESDISIFCNPGGRRITSLKDLRREDIIFKFANVSESDPPDTIFIVSDNYINPPPAKPWWDFFSKSPPLKDEFVVFLKNGDGMFYTKRKSDQKEIIGILPPREPKFLAP